MSGFNRVSDEVIREAIASAISAAAGSSSTALMPLGPGQLERGLQGLGQLVPGPGYPYVVASGDSLTLITWKFGREPREWLDLLRNNPQVVPPYFGIDVGQTLVLPVGWPLQPTRLGLPTTAWTNDVSQNYPPPGEADWNRWWVQPEPAVPDEVVPDLPAEAEKETGIAPWKIGLAVAAAAAAVIIVIWIIARKKS